MAVINQSYDALCDPDRRVEHDQWIAEQESLARTQSTSETCHQDAPRQATAPPPSPPLATSSRFSSLTQLVRHVLSYWVIYAGLGVWVWYANADHTPASAKVSAALTSPPPKSKPLYVRPANAPNGRPWPTSAAYLAPSSPLSKGGLSNATVDNSVNDSDVHVKLNWVSGGAAIPVREFFIPIGEQFKLTNLFPGEYDIRYCDLNKGGCFRSESFTLRETPTENGTQFSRLTMTLYKVRNGNMQTYDLDESEF